MGWGAVLGFQMGVPGADGLSVGLASRGHLENRPWVRSSLEVGDALGAA